ncbi:hypothetical protein [Streptomyces alkaliterrae]|uniref:Zinc ABC transporter substrate-binding protein n=1 Tax=Streptomyces alkaliterrae TaxID=2213162 RepID=A0A5P0YVQ7_9ACTN|nr:hypothetical protein [Streptomyces alkaliterrae]MBB1256300.1 hypothetical protein [Streptomyces alkaliterrae]MBB1262157.1 hypothetical protein [Streptomyces alkaliterrae]MQS04060.1 hypothetical protein [Streptomyces alkaliterrae]
MKLLRSALLGALTTALLTLPLATAAHADETHHHSHNGPRVSFITTGQIDDPLEDVLEHLTVLGLTHIVD